MVSTFTPNIQLEEPARGDDVGVWDTPVNNNMTLLDLVAGGRTTISGAAGSVTLAAAQYECKTITLNSTLIASIALTFPTSFTKSYEIYHSCTGSSAFTITLQTTAAGGQAVCASPGEIIDVINDGTNIRFKNLGRIGEYWDYVGSSMPNWVSGCTVPPYVNADGSACSSATYPVLFGLVGATLPDSRSRARIATGQSAGRISSAVSGFAPDTVGASGGAQAVVIGQSNLPAHNHPVSDPGHTHATNAAVVTSGLAFGGNTGAATTGAVNTAAVTGLTVSNSTYANQAFPVLQPTYVGGLTLIRAG